MVLIIISIIVFVIMLLFPIGLGLFFLRKEDGEVMSIHQSRIRDPRYFVKSFTGMFDKKWNDYDGSGKIYLSHEENVLEADGVVEYPTICTSIVYAENIDFRPEKEVRFEKEVYARKNAYFYGAESVRAVCSKKDLVLGSGTKVIRWVDAEGTLTVYDDCDLGISASSATRIIIIGNCHFRRLYAPIILLGDVQEEVKQLDEDRQNINLDTTVVDVIRNIKYVDDEIADENSVITGTIITKHDLFVLNGLTVKGHLRSNGNIRVYDNVNIYGNLFAEGDIYLGQNVRVFGTVFTQENFIAESGVTIGQNGKIKSVIARGKVFFDNNCRVYGYVSSEIGGEFAGRRTF